MGSSTLETVGVGASHDFSSREVRSHRGSHDRTQCSMLAGVHIEVPTIGDITGLTDCPLCSAGLTIRISARQGEEALGGVDAPAGGELRSRVADVVRSGPHAVESRVAETLRAD